MDGTDETIDIGDILGYNDASATETEETHASLE